MENMLKPVSNKIFCPLINKEIEDGYCYELCNIGTDEILLKGDEVKDWKEAYKICDACGRYND